MQKFIEFSKKYYLKELLLIFLVSCFMFFLTYGKQDAYLVDVGREAYIPWQMLKGQLLYKDIFNVYGPLGYQINAILYAIFGIHLNTLFWAGFVNSFVILFSVFYISKMFVKKNIALMITFTVLFVCAYAQIFFNFIFVYSYNAVYALSGFLLSLLFALKFLKEKSNYSLFLSFLFAGFSFANKIENLPYFCLLFLCLPFWVKKDWKKYFYSVLAFFIFPIISFGVLMLQGVGINDFLNAFDLIKKLIQSPATSYFYRAYGIYFNYGLIKSYFNTILLKHISILLLPMLFIGILNYIKHTYINQKVVKAWINVFSVMIIIAVIFKNYGALEECFRAVFWWLGIACLLILGYWMFNLSYKILVKKERLSDVSIKDKMFIFLLISSILISFKGCFTVTTTCYGTFTITAMIMPFVIFLIEYATQGLNDKVRYVAGNMVVFFLCFVIFGSLIFNFGKMFKDKKYHIYTPRGIMLVREIYPKQNELINYIKNNTPQGAKIVTIPEGAMINFLSERDSDNKYYYLIPGNVEIFGDDIIASDFEKNPPDYFVTTDMIYSVYGKGNICTYAPKTCDFIGKNYVREVEINGVVGFILYRKK